jgi:mRNA export factor
MVNVIVPVAKSRWYLSLQEGNKIFSGGADNAGRMFDVNTGQQTQVAQHEAPISVVGWVDAQSGILATGSWDKTIKVYLFFFS